MDNFRMRLLCIDDDPTGLALRKTLLESAGYDVCVAGSGHEGVRLVASQPFDAVILGYDMPQTDGDRLASVIRTVRTRLPIIMLSGAPAVPKKLLQSIDGFIPKGESSALLLSTIQQLVT
ncbi:MAG: response regulator [Terriglobales bacterium]